MSIKQFAKTAYMLAFTRAIEFLIGLIRIKVNAVLLGVRGVGIVDQIAFFAQQTSTFTLLSMAEGLVKQIAESNRMSNAERVDLICSALKGYCVMLMTFMLLSLSVVTILDTYLSKALFGAEEYTSYYYIAVACIPFLVINSIPFSILKALKGAEYIAKARMLTVLINLLVLLPLVYFYGLEGAALYIAISYIVTLLVNFHFAKKKYLKKFDITFTKILRARVRRSHVKELLVFSGFGVTVGVLFILSEMAIRAMLVQRLGVESIGLYSPVIMWASMFTGIILPTFSTYLYPRFCETDSNEIYSELVNDGFRLASYSILPFLLLGIPLKEFFITFFYSDDFLEAKEFVLIHFFGLVFYAWWYIYSQLMTPSGRIKLHGFFLICLYSINVSIVYFFIPSFELYAYAFKFLIPPMLFFALYASYCKIKMNITLSRHNVYLMLYLCFCMAVIWLLELYGNILLSLCSGILLCLSSLALLADNEKSIIKLKVHSIFSKI